MKLKMDADGHVVVEDGKPVYTNDDGKDIAIDGAGLYAKVPALNAEAKAHREAKEEAFARLKAFEGIEDPEAAMAAIETVRNLDQGKLVAAGKVEEVQAAAKKAAQEQVAEAARSASKKIAELEERYGSLEKKYHGEKLEAAFASSKFIAEKSAIPADFMKARFGESFKVTESGIIAVDRNGSEIYSVANPGEPAGFDEALSMLVEKSPNRDYILKGHNGGGSGQRAGGSPGTKEIPRSQFNKMPQAERNAKLSEGYSIVSD